MANFKDIFDESFARVYVETEQRKHLIDRFYVHFLSSSQEVVKTFERAGTDFERQKKVLAASLSHMYEFYRNPEDDQYHVTLAALHGMSRLKIQPYMYDLRIESLVSAVRDTDPDFGEHVDLAWRVVMAPGIAFMKFFYAR